MQNTKNVSQPDYHSFVPYGWLEIPVHSSWERLLQPRVLELLARIAYLVGDQAAPQPSWILRFLTTDLHQLKIVVIGQDPYPGVGAATGRAFEVGHLKSWTEPFRQVSLKNMIRLLWCVKKQITPYSGLEEYRKVPGFSVVRREIEEGRFALAKPGLLFSSWEDQGVLLLNTSLTIANGKSGIHQAIWAPFTSIVIEYMVAQRPDLIWFLWGAHARSLAHAIKEGTIYESNHPMMCSEKAGNDFLRNPCFHETSTIVNWLGTDNPDKS